LLSEEKSSKSSSHQSYSVKFKLLEEQNKNFMKKLEEIEHSIRDKEQMLTQERLKAEQLSTQNEYFANLISMSIEQNMTIRKGRTDKGEEK